MLPGAPGALWLDVPPPAAPLPFDLGALATSPDCRVHVAPLAAFSLLADGAGATQTWLPLPAVPGLAGFRFRAQALFLENAYIAATNYVSVPLSQ